MPLYRAPGGRLVLFVHVPKTGGTSLEVHLEARFGPALLLDHTWTRAATWRESLGASPQHLTADDLARMGLVAAADWCFAVVREPLARLISEFRYNMLPAVPDRQRRLTRLGFSGWLATIAEAQRHEPGVLDNHIRPQAEMTPPEAEVFRFEDGLGAVIARLDALFGPGPAGGLPHALKSGGGRPVVRARDVALARRLYAVDYARFGYAPPPVPPEGPRAALDGALRHLAGRAMGAHAARAWRKGRL